MEMQNRSGRSIPIRVLLVDRHPIFRRAVRSILAGCKEVAVVGEALDGKQGIDKAGELSPDIVLTDISRPHCDGVELTRVLSRTMPQTRVIILTESEAQSDLTDAVVAGAQGYILKSVEPEDLVRSILTVADGQPVVSPAIAGRLVITVKSSLHRAMEQAHVRDGTLSEREREVLELVAQGRSNRVIANSLYISENTVKTHMRNIFRKLNVQGRKEAVSYALGRHS